MKDLTKGNTMKILISFALPVLIGALFNLAYNLADMRIVGQFLGDNAIAAVGSVSTLNDLINGFMLGVANGFGVVIARYFGEGSPEKVRKSFAVSLLFAIVISCAIMLFSLLNIGGILHLLNVEEIHFENALAYIKVILSGMIFLTVYNSLVAGLRAIGDAYTPLFFLIFSALMNVGLDYLFVGVLKSGVQGAAIATVISQLIAMSVCLIYTLVRYPILRPHWNDFIPSSRYAAMLLPAGISMGLMSSLVNFGTVSLQSAINNLGTNTVVAHAATRKLTSLFMMPFMAFGTAMATYCGQNYGAGKIDRIRKGLFHSLAISFCWCAVVVAMAYTICPYLIIAITKTENSEIIKTACKYQRIDTLFYAIVPTISIIRSSLQGMGDHITPIISSGLELIGKVVFAFLLTPVLGYTAIIWAEPVVWCIMVIPLIISIYHRVRKH